MDLTKYKNKSRILLIKSPNYKLKDYLNIKHVYQKHIKKFHKRHVKLITKIDKKGFKINFIDFDGKTKKVLNKVLVHFKYESFLCFFMIVDKIGSTLDKWLMPEVQ